MARTTVRRLLSAPYLTGLLVFRGQVIGEGAWPPIVDRGTWNEVQERRAMRASAFKRRPHRFYLLRGVVACKKCGTHMSGSGAKDTPIYVCGRNHRFDKETRCARGIGAAVLEEFVVDAAITLLTNLDLSGSPATATVLTQQEQDAIATDEHELAELKDMWDHREVSTREYRQMRRTVEDRINKIRRKTIVRPTADVLKGLVGLRARQRWNELEANKGIRAYERRAPLPVRRRDHRQTPRAA